MYIPPAMKVLVIDNYDSFTYNLVQILGSLGADVSVVRNDAAGVEDIRAMHPDAIVLSPGPGGPEDAGVCKDVVRQLGREIPILGVCLGHQCIAEALGGRVIKGRRPVHGKTSEVSHEGQGVLDGLPSPVRVARYHSLVVDERSLPSCLRVTAHSPDGAVMALRHESWPVEGVQFHPESFMTDQGCRVLRNLLKKRL
jgi:anthranilate synthase component 2/para-aminobenzoate synthetase component 2